MKDTIEAEKNLLTVTEDALEQLKAYRREDDPEKSVFRVFINGYG